MNDLDYIFAVARIRVKEKSLLTTADFRQMASLKDEDAVLEFLLSHGFGEGASQKSSEQVLATEEDKNLALLSELQVDPQFLYALSLPKIFHNLKAGIQELVTSETHENAFYKVPEFDREFFLDVLKKREFDRLPSSMRAVAESAIEIMLKTRDGQRLHTIVDKGCLNAMEQEAASTKDPLFKEYLRLYVALFNIKIAVRSLKMHKSYDFIKEALSSSSLLDTEELAKAASDSLEALEAYLKTQGFADAAAALEGSFSQFEVWQDNRLMKLIQSQRTVTESVGPVLAYYLARENEIKMARIILTAKANGFSDEVIQERMRVMYV